MVSIPSDSDTTFFMYNENKIHKYNMSLLNITINQISVLNTKNASFMISVMNFSNVLEP